ncbi:hypothetical protein ABE169_06735 [Bacillus subtilis]
MSIKLIKKYAPKENAERLWQLQQDAQTVETFLNKQESDLAAHKDAKIAHNSSQISYEGTDVGTAIKAVNKLIENLVLEASKGNSNAEVVAARTTYAGVTYNSLKSLLDFYLSKVDNGQNFKLTTDKGLAKQAITTGDLNDITEPGVYWVDWNSGSWDVLNLPVQQAGFLEVIKAAFSDGTMQRYTPYRGNVTTQYIQSTYFRNWGVGNKAWTQWSTTADKTQTDAAIAAITSQKLNVSTTKISDATTSGNDYPVGVTIQEITPGTATGFPYPYGIVHTVKYNNARMTQHFYSTGGDMSSQGSWSRYWHTNTGWTQWYGLFGNSSWCNVSVTNEQKLTQGYTQKVKFDRVISDSHSQFNTSNNRFTAKVRGMYMVGVGLYVDRIKKYNNVELNLYRNGVRYKVVHQNRQDPYNPASNEFNMGHYASGVTVPLEVGDYLEMHIFVGAGQDLTISNNSGWYNYFDIYRIGDIPMNV